MVYLVKDGEFEVTKRIKYDPDALPPADKSDYMQYLSRGNKY